MARDGMGWLYRDGWGIVPHDLRRQAYVEQTNKQTRRNETNGPFLYTYDYVDPLYLYLRLIA